MPRYTAALLLFLLPASAAWSATSGDSLAYWIRRAANCSFDARRLAVLVPIHPPKFEEAIAFFRSSVAAGAGDELDLYFIFGSENDRARFESALQDRGAQLSRPVRWRRSLVVRKGDTAADYAWATSKDYIVAKKHAALAQFLGDVVARDARRGGALWPYRYVVVLDSETAWARPAKGLAAAVAARAAAPTWYGTDAEEAHVLGAGLLRG